MDVRKEGRRGHPLANLAHTPLQSRPGKWWCRGLPGLPHRPAAEKFDLVFLDPPYGAGCWKRPWRPSPRLTLPMTENGMDSLRKCGGERPSERQGRPHAKGGTPHHAGKIEITRNSPRSDGTKSDSAGDAAVGIGSHMKTAIYPGS